MNCCKEDLNDLAAEKIYSHYHLQILFWFATGAKARLPAIEELDWSDSSEVVVCALSALHSGSFKAATSLSSDIQASFRAKKSHGCLAACGEHALS